MRSILLSLVIGCTEVSISKMPSNTVDTSVVVDTQEGE